MASVAVKRKEEECEKLKDDFNKYVKCLQERERTE